LVFTVTRSGETATAASANYSMASGTATAGSDFSASSGIVSFSAGQTSASITVPTIDDITVESSETMSIALSAPSAGAVIGTSSAVGTITDNDVAPADISIGNATASEGGVLTFAVTRTGPTSGPVSVAYATASGSALTGSDFAGTSGTLSLASGQVIAYITVATTDDSAPESTETMSVNLSSPSSGANIVAATGTGTINDNDATTSPAVTISDASATEGEYLTFTVSLSAPSASTVTVNFATANGTAGTNDYSGTSGTLTFAPGQTSLSVQVLANTDLRNELDEYFYINLSAPANATILDGQGVGIIYDDGSGGCLTC
jgi:hypothetical protein